MTVLVKTVLEEFEQGAWVADVMDVEQLTGSFELAGETWIGTVESQREENGFYVGRIVGGAGGLSNDVRDRYYKNRTTLAEVARGVTSTVGETLGTIADVRVTTYMRVRGSAGDALSRLANTFGQRWWVERGGSVSIGLRPSGPEAQGVRVDSGPDGSVYLANPESVQIGGTYDGQTIRHVRWYQDANRFEAILYFDAFAESPEAEGLDYAKLHSALVHEQNSDGSLELIVDGRYSISRVQYLSGIPTADLTLAPGDRVLLGFYNGDPRAPYAVATQRTSGTAKGVARVDDTVNAGTITASGGSGSPVLLQYTPPGGSPGTPSASIVLSGGRITSGSERVKIA